MPLCAPSRENDPGEKPGVWLVDPQRSASPDSTSSKLCFGAELLEAFLSALCHGGGSTWDSCGSFSCPFALLFFIVKVMVLLIQTTSNAA
jgi:hypothetical protein